MATQLNFVAILNYAFIYNNPMDYYCEYQSPIGSLFMVSDGISLTGLRFKNQFPKQKNICSKSLPIFKQVKNWLDQYFLGKAPGINFPIKPSGTEFQLKVWNAIKDIPYGQTVTYKDVATKIGIHSSRAIGMALSKNPILILVPCHRVIGTNNKLTGYAGGIQNKEWLINWEKNNRK